MMTVVLYEWFDEMGEVEDFIVFDLMSRTMDFFSFPGTKMSMYIDEEAEALLKDYENL